MTRAEAAERDAQRCADIAARRRPVPPGLYVCQCDHLHPAGATWCYLCEYPTRDPAEPGGAS